MTRNVMKTVGRQAQAVAGMFLLLVAIGTAAYGQERPVRSAAFPPGLLDSLAFRSVGPAVMGGRIHDVEVRPDAPSTVYVATASGGLWKTTNKGTTWTSIFEEQPVSTFGDVALAASDPQVVWAGTGEQQNRQSTSWGNGVYRSTDGGTTWSHLGLENTRHIGRVQVHPEDPDVAYVAALGNLWKASEARGVYKTTDGGASWTKVLYVDSLTGVVDLAMDPEDPSTLYAAAYQRLRRTWGFNGGGPGSGIYKTTDGGETWQELTTGLPEGDKGRIGLDVAATAPRVLYATVEHAEEGGFYRTEDGGASWAKVNDLNPRPMYYSHVVIDPTDADRVYVLGVEFYKSEDGGQTFRQMPTRPTYDVGVHSDHHALWVDPSDPEHLYLAGDAGLHETWDGGETYARINNIPIGQFYAIGLDQRDPYYIYGGMQDNHSWMGPSATRRYIGIINDDWEQTGFGDGMYQQPTRAEDGHRAVYINSQNGNLTRVDAETGDILGLRPLEEDEDEEYRFDWVTPSLASRHDPATVYFGGNRLFISRDRGSSWTRTEDLTKAIDRDSLRLMGVLGADIALSPNDGTSSYGEITTIAESPLDPQVLWVGTDDGNVQVSRDGGTSWSEVSRYVDGVGDTTYVSRVLASAASPGTAYVAFDAHRDGDFAPYVFKTEDFGRNWQPVVEGLPEGSVNVIVEHPDNPRVLFLGTEHALFASADAGASWTRVESGLPVTLYDDLAIHPREKDLVVGTHGRSLWVLDDTTPLAEWSAAVQDEDAHLFSIRPARLFHYWKSTSYRGQAAYAGANPPFGALVNYHLGAAVDSVRLVVRDAQGRAVRTLHGPGTAGTIHRVVWDLHHPPPPRQDDDDEGDPDRVGEVIEPETEEILPQLPRPLEAQGPLVAPGTYTVVLEAGAARDSQTVRVEAAPAMQAQLTDAQWQARETFLLDLAALQRDVFEAAERAGVLDDELTAAREAAAQEAAEGEDLPDELEARSDTASARVSALRRVRGRLAGLAGDFNRSGVTQGTLYPPTVTHRQRLERLRQAFREELEAFEAFEADERAR